MPFFELSSRPPIKNFTDIKTLDHLKKVLRVRWYSRNRETLPESDYKQLFVFSSTGGKKPITPRAIQQFVKNIIRETKSIPVDYKERLGPHSFRHTFAIYGLEAGIDIYTLAQLLGHESLNTTMRYLKMFDDQLKKAINGHPFARDVMYQIKERLESK